MTKKLLIVHHTPSPQRHARVPTLRIEDRGDMQTSLSSSGTILAWVPVRMVVVN